MESYKRLVSTLANGYPWDETLWQCFWSGVYRKHELRLLFSPGMGGSAEMSKVNAAKELWAIDLELQKLRMKILFYYSQKIENRSFSNCLV